MRAANRTEDPVVALRNTAQAVCDDWAPLGVSVSLASITLDVPQLLAAWPRHTLVLDLRGLVAASPYPPRRLGVDEARLATLLRRLSAPLRGLTALMDDGPPRPAAAGGGALQPAVVCRQRPLHPRRPDPGS